MFIEKNFEKNGYIKIPVNKSIIVELRKKIINSLKKNYKFKISKSISDEDFLNNFHKYIKLKDLNEVRFKTYNKINKDQDLHKLYYDCCREALDKIIGNEISMQKKINLSIQIPKDKNSLLDMHSDIYAGESPFQVVVWIPLVDVFKTKAMFITDPRNNKKMNDLILNSNRNTTKQLYNNNKKKFKFIDVKFGELIIFSPLILHGNTVNTTNQSRLSLNCRFKSLLSPYDVTVKSHRNIPNFYRPLKIMPMTKIGFNYLKKYSK